MKTSRETDSQRLDRAARRHQYNNVIGPCLAGYKNYVFIAFATARDVCHSGVFARTHPSGNGAGRPSAVRLFWSSETAPERSETTAAEHNGLDAFFVRAKPVAVCRMKTGVKG